MTDRTRTSNSIAIIGMAGRFPGADNVDELWQLLQRGGHSVKKLSDVELAAAGVSPSLMANPRYVKSCIRLEGYDQFDAGFFGYSPRQATSLDPQARLFLECAWESLEHAGYDTERYEGSVGLFAGAGTNSYLYAHLQELLAVNFGNWHQTSLDGEKDFLTTRVSYKLGLKGPSIAVQSACSTSLVAVHLACQSLLTFESDMALAGGVSIKFGNHNGYLHEEGGISSSDGICRPYDAEATGAVPGSGCGIVVLKRLEDAIREGDEIHAVICGTAVNNDGAEKAGFSAPGVKGQVRLISSALSFADLQPSDIGMIEGHGTGTVLGDAVELTALSEAFATGEASPKWCALGSIKSNIGHLDSAAGVAGLIKAVLCLKHAHFVPTVSFSRPNPALSAADSPFFVNTQYTPWPSDGRPRRAGVSSFGMGGTNAHVIVEEAPAPTMRIATASPQVFPLSAHTGEALDQLCTRLAGYLEKHPHLDLADVANTLQTGRRRFAHRRVLVASTHSDFVRGLRETTSSCNDPHADRPVVFLFPGQGSQRPGAVSALYDSEPFFREQVDECAARFETELGFDIRTFICQVDDPDALPPSPDTLTTQPAVFTVGYSLAKLWMHWGVTPSSLIGHSVGEYIAACISGVLSLRDCVKLLSTRARLVSAQTPGAMLAVWKSEDEIRPLLANTVSIAAINSPTQCVLSGSNEDVDELARQLTAGSIEHRRLFVSHAFHSCLMDPALPELERAARRCRFEPPRLPYISCVTGEPASESDACRPEFWARHLRQPVNFQAAVARAAAGGAAIFLEIGSGHALCALARQMLGAETACVESLGNGGLTDRIGLLTGLGRLWSAGARIGWSALHQDGPPRRVGLVPYPFQRQRYWVQAQQPVATLIEEAQHVPQPALESAAAEAPAPAPASTVEWTELEAEIASVWGEVLGVDVATIGRADTFVSLGGDSLIAARILARLNEEFGLRISVRVLIAPPGTIEALAMEIVAELASAVDAARMDEYLGSAHG